MRNRIVVTAGVLLMWAGMVFGQAAPGKPNPGIQQPAVATATSTLKPEIALHIRDLQLAQAHAEAEFQSIQTRIKTLQDEYQRRQVELASAVGNSLKDSGLDPVKYDVNPDTLAVTPKPIVETKKP